jgi:hypothetical protein
VHAWFAVSIARQPLNVHATPAARFHGWSLFHDAVRRQGPGADFFAVYHAGVAVRQGATVYADGEAPRITPYFFTFRYLPVVAHTVGRAASTLGPRAAYLAWLAILEALLAIVVWQVTRTAASPWRGCAAAVALLVSTPYLLELHMGQFTFACAAVAFLVLSRLASGRSGTTVAPLASQAMLLAVSWSLKVITMVVLPAMLRHRTARRVAVTSLAIFLVVNVPFFVRAPSDWQFFRGANLEAPDYGMGAGNYGFTYLSYRISADLTGGWTNEARQRGMLAWRAAGLVAAVLLVLFAKERDLLAGATLLLCAHFLTYFQVWEHHYSALVLFLAALFAHPAGPRGRAAELLVAGLALLVLPTLYSMLAPRPDEWARASFYLPPATKVAGVLLATVACVMTVSRQPAVATASATLR